MPLSSRDGSADALTAAQRDRSRGWILVILIFAIVWGVTTHGTFAGSGDEPHYLMIAHSIAFDGDLDLTNDYRDATLIGGGTLEPGSHAIPRGGKLRPVHDIGMPLLFAPVVRIAYPLAEKLGDALPASLLRATRLNKALLLRQQLSLLMALVTGAMARELFLVLRRLGGTPRSAFLWALLFAVSPPVLSHSFLFFTEIPSAFIVLFVFRRLSVEPLEHVTAAALAGGLTGFLLLIHARNVGIVGGLALITLLLRVRRRLSTRLLAAFLAFLAAGVFARTAVTYGLWGSLVTTPLAQLGEFGSPTAFVHEMFVRATGLLFDREYGLLGYGPIYLLAGPGFFLLWRVRPRLGADLVIVPACYLLLLLPPVTNTAGFTGGWAPAARFLVPVTPLLWVAVYWFALSAVNVGRAVAGALVGLQIAIDAYVWQFPKTLWNDGDGVTAFRGSAWLPSWADRGATLPFAIALSIAVAIGCVCYRSARSPVEVSRA